MHSQIGASYRATKDDRLRRNDVAEGLAHLPAFTIENHAVRDDAAIRCLAGGTHCTFITDQCVHINKQKRNGLREGENIPEVNNDDWNQPRCWSLPSR